MNDKETIEMARSNYAAQMNMLGYGTDGNPKDMVEVVRCKYCKNRKDVFNCPIASEGMTTPDDWFCADGKRRS